jgi:glyoxylase-like metal-dependent hydrolase (beta-lactamase superfamily II)
MIGTPVDDGVGRIDGGFVNAYTYTDDSGTYLVDTTFSRTGRPVRKAFDRAGVGLERLSAILLTHQHVDHIRGAARVQRDSRAIVVCHSADAPFVEGRTAPHLSVFFRLFMRPRPVAVGRPVKDGDTVGPLRVIFVPGHTVGEVAFYQPERRILFSGDSVVERDGSLTLPGRRIAADLAQAVRSLQVLRALEIELLLPGHGVPVRKDVASRLDDLIARAPAEFLGRPNDATVARPSQGP